MLLAPLSNLEFPSWRAPGIDQTHPAFVANRFVGLPTLSGAGYLDLRSAGRFTTGGSPASNIIDASLGPTLTLASTSSQYVSRAGYSTAVDAVGTLAAFIRPTTVNALATIIGNGASSGFFFRVSATGFLTVGATSIGTITSTIGLSAGVPYLVAVSINTSASTFVAVNLTNGQIQTYTGSGLTLTTTTSGTIYIGQQSSGNYFNGLIGPTMYSPTYLSKAQMIAWAADPWAFWYPDDDFDYRILGLSSGAVSLAGLSLSRLRGTSTFSGAKTMAARGGLLLRTQAASTQATATAARSALISEARSATALAAAFAAQSKVEAEAKSAAILAAALSAASSARAPSRTAASLAASFVAHARAMASARGAQGTGAFLSATGALRSSAAARGAASLAAALSGRSSSSAGGHPSPALLASLSARVRAAGGVRGVFSSGAFLYAASGLAQASLRAEAAILATVHLVFNPALVLKAPATIRSLAAPATTRLLKAISTIRNLKAPR